MVLDLKTSLATSISPVIMFQTTFKTVYSLMVLWTQTRTLCLPTTNSTTTHSTAFTSPTTKQRRLSITNNTTNGQGRHGLYLENDLNGNGAGTDISILSHTADSNGEVGIFVENGSGRLQVLDPVASNNGAAGLKIANFDNPLAGDFTTIGVTDLTPDDDTDNNVATFTGNAIGIEVELIGDGLTQNVLMTQSLIDDQCPRYSSKGRWYRYNIEFEYYRQLIDIQP